MDVAIVSVLIGIVAGAAGFWVSTFWIQPILRYRDLKHQIHRDFIYFAQVINAEGLNDTMQALYRERILSNRNMSASLSAAVLELPGLYTMYLKLKGLDPKSAAERLIGYSNTTEYEQSHKIQASIRKRLGLPPET